MALVGIPKDHSSAPQPGNDGSVDEIEVVREAGPDEAVGDPEVEEANA